MIALTPRTRGNVKEKSLGQYGPRRRLKCRCETPVEASEELAVAIAVAVAVAVEPIIITIAAIKSLP